MSYRDCNAFSREIIFGNVGEWFYALHVFRIVPRFGRIRCVLTVRARTFGGRDGSVSILE